MLKEQLLTRYELLLHLIPALSERDMENAAENLKLAKYTDIKKSLLI